MPETNPVHQTFHATHELPEARDFPLHEFVEAQPPRVTDVLKLQRMLKLCLAAVPPLTVPMGHELHDLQENILATMREVAENLGHLYAELDEIGIVATAH